MSAECDALRAELNRISQQIAALDRKYIPISEKQPIYAAIKGADNKASSALEKIVTLVTVVTNLAATILSVKSTADSANSKAGQALNLAGVVKAGLEFVLGEMRQFVIRNRFEALENRVSVIDRSLDIVFGVAQSNRALINGLRNRLDALAIELARLWRFAYELRDRIIQLLGRVVTLEQAVDLLKRLVADLRQRLVEAERKINGLLAAVGALTVAVGILQAQIAALIATVARLAALVAQLVIGLAKLTATVVRLALQVAANSRAIASLKNELTTLNKRVDRLEIALRQIAFKVQLAIDYAKLAIEIALRRRPGNIDISAIANAVLNIISPRLSAQIAATVNTSINIHIGRTVNLSQLIALANQNIQLTKDVRKKLEADGIGALDLSPCEPPVLAHGEEAPPTQIEYQGAGLVGIYSAISAITQSLNLIHTDTKCPPEVASALPMYFETRPGEVPQLVIQWGPINGSASRWNMSLPHPKSNISHTYNFRFPAYRKGNLQLTYRLRDNSKVILNAENKISGLKVFSYLKSLIDPAFIDRSAEPTFTENAGQRRLKIVEVKATYLQKFEGHRNQIALWSKSL